MDDKEAKEVKRYSRVMKKVYNKAPIDVKNCFAEAKYNRDNTHYLKEDLSMDNIQQLEWNDDMKLRAANESLFARLDEGQRDKAHRWIYRWHGLNGGDRN